MADGLDWHITGLFYPGYTVSDIEYVGRLANPTDGRVDIPLNDSRRAQVTISTLGDDGDIAAQIYRWTYYYTLKAYYRDQLVFWGPINLIAVDAAANTMTLSATDPSIRLIHHFARRGDLAQGAPLAELTKENGDRGWVTIDEVGMRALRDCGLNTAGQTSRGVPDLGIVDGTNDFGDPTGLMGIDRGKQVWESMQQLAASNGPDFELEPIEDTDEAYCQLNTYTKQGTDKSATVQFHYGTGKQNLEALSFAEGAKFITHVHALTSDGKYRFTEANTDTSGQRGVYVEWDATDYHGDGVDPDSVEDALREYGQDALKAYSRPLIEVTLGLPLETDTSYLYGTNYIVGDRVGVAGKTGALALIQAADYYRITNVSLQQANHDNAVQPELVVVPDLVGNESDAFTGSED